MSIPLEKSIFVSFKQVILSKSHAENLVVCRYSHRATNLLRTDHGIEN